jgi:hypothetical protein
MIVVLATCSVPLFVGAGNDPKSAAAPAAKRTLEEFMRQMDSYREKLPPAADIDEMNGEGTPEANGDVVPDSHLQGIAHRMGVQSKAECLVLLTYLKDSRVSIRHIAAFALDSVLHAFPDGFSAEALDQLNSELHRKMVRAFVERIEKFNP